MPLELRSLCASLLEYGGDYGSGSGNDKRQKEPPLPGLSPTPETDRVANLPPS
jgi:hypothetical protein